MIRTVLIATALALTIAGLWAIAETHTALHLDPDGCEES